MDGTQMVKDVVGVGIGRFQVDELHEGHRHLLDSTSDLSGQLCIVVGVTGGQPTKEDPLPFWAVEPMLQEAYPDAVILKQPDHPLSNVSWSRLLDRMLLARFPGKEIVLYGSRDSFIPKYRGKFRTVELAAIPNVSGTDRRKSIEFSHTREARQALIHHAQTRYPINYRTVDIAIIDRWRDRILLIGKDAHDGKLSFCGGYNDKKGATDEEAAAWETDEEVPGTRIGPFTLLGTLPVDDPRYRKSTDGVVTTLFRTDYRGGNPQPGDDADRVEWVSRKELREALVPWHQPLADIVLANWPYPWPVRILRFLFGPWMK